MGVSDLFALPLSRASKLKFLNDLHSHLPANYTRLHSARYENNPSCFWYTRLAAESLKVDMVRFAVDDTDADNLRVIWVEHVAGWGRGSSRGHGLLQRTQKDQKGDGIRKGIRKGRDSIRPDRVASLSDPGDISL